MERPSLQNKVFTDNPLLDEIVYNCRELAMSTVLKDSDRADKNETLESIQAGDILVAVCQGRVSFDFFNYDYDFLKSTGIPWSEAELIYYANHNDEIPQEYRSLIMNNAAEDYKDNYLEMNNYYRMLHGLPDYDETGTWNGFWCNKAVITNTSIDSSIISIYPETEDYVLMHELDAAYVNILYNTGVIDEFLNDTTRLASWGKTRNDAEYLLHLGERKVDFYLARTAQKFQLLYCPDCDAVEVQKRFKDLIEANRLYITYTVYSEAYKFRSDYYDNFMMVLIIIQTFIDMIVELPEYLIRRDIFDTRTCRYIFESNGVEYFKDIPLTYQVALVKNLNKLIKYKSTDKCIVDIISVFGFDNITAFKYYILRDRNAVKQSGEYTYLDYKKEKTDSEGVKTIVDDNDKNYDIKFLKVPILEEFDNYIRTNSNLYSYDTIAGTDAYWTGDKDYETVKSAVKDLEFTVLRSKYYSIEAVIDLTKRNFTLVYFLNMLLYNNVDSSLLQVNLPNISSYRKFRIVNVIILLYTLSYIYYGVEPTIQDKVTKIAKILGFNMETDMETIASELAEKHGGLTFKDLGIEGFTWPEDNQYLSFGNLQEIYINNKAAYDHVKEMLIDPPNKRIYDAYKYIYDAMFIMDLNEEFLTYEDPETGETKLFSTYLEYLKYIDTTLYSWVQNNILSLVNLDDRQEACINAIQAITSYLKDYIDKDIVDLNDVFAGLPSISVDFITTYISEVVNFFKSFKILTHGGSIVYTFDDKLENYVHLIDDALLKYLLDKSDIVHIEDYIAKNKVDISPELRYEMIDKIWLDISTWIQKNYHEFYDSDKYSQYTDIMRDYKEHVVKFGFNDTSLEETFALDAIIQLLVTLTLDDNIGIEDKIYNSTINHNFYDYYNEWLRDVMQAYYSTYTVEEGVPVYDDDGNLLYYKTKIQDDMTTTTKYESRTYAKFADMFNSQENSISYSDDYGIIDDYYLIRTQSG